MMEKCHFSLGLSSINYHVGWLQHQLQWLSLGVSHLLLLSPRPGYMSGKSHPTLVTCFLKRIFLEICLQDNEFVIILYVCKILNLLFIMHFKMSKTQATNVKVSSLDFKQSFWCFQARFNISKSIKGPSRAHITKSHCIFEVCQNSSLK